MRYPVNRSVLCGIKNDLEEVVLSVEDGLTNLVVVELENMVLLVVESDYNEKESPPLMGGLMYMNCTNPILLKDMNFRVPCGHCVSCQIQRSAEWSARLIHEKSYYESSIFVTLTYDDDHLPLILNEKSPQFLMGTLVPKHFTNWMKRLRKYLDGRKIKYFGCGEYGEKSARPHYHLVLFGMASKEFTFVRSDYRNGRNYHMYRHTTWPYGLISIGSVSYDSCRYVVDYILKEYRYKHWSSGDDREKPFQRCSKGIGERYALDNKKQLLDQLGFTVNGKKRGLPRYYRKLLDIDPDAYKQLIDDYYEEVIEYFKQNGITENDDIFKEVKKSLRQTDKNRKALHGMKKKRSL